MAVRRLKQSSGALQKPPTRKKLLDVQTWLSAALTLQQVCKDDSFDASAADGHNGLGSFGSLIAKKMDYLSRLSGNALALVDRVTSVPQGTGRGDDNYTRGSLTPTSVKSPSHSGSRNRSGIYAIALSEFLRRRLFEIVIYNITCNSTFYY